MSTQYILILVTIMIFLVLDLVTSSVRSAIRSVSKAKLLQFKEEQEAEVDRTIELLQNLPRTLASLQIFHVLVRFLLVGLIVIFINSLPLSENIWFVLGITAGAALLVGWLDWIISRQAYHNVLPWTMTLAGFAQVITWLFSPLASISIALSQDSTENYSTYETVEDEVKILVDAGEVEGELEQDERKMIYSVFRLGDTLTREIMVPRIDITGLDVNTPINEAIDEFLDSGYSRLPVFEERVDNIVGVLYAKDVLKVWREGSDTGGSIRPFLREAYFVPEAKLVDELLEEIQSRRVHLAVVVDEYGGVAGIVTLEDIIEEIFGEIQDEYDEEELPYQVLADGNYLFQGRVDIDDFNDVMGSNLPGEDADTLSGFIYQRLGHVPEVGENVREDGILLTVDQISGRRIRTVRAFRESMETDAHADR